MDTPGLMTTRKDTNGFVSQIQGCLNVLYKGHNPTALDALRHVLENVMDSLENAYDQRDDALARAAALTNERDENWLEYRELVDAMEHPFLTQDDRVLRVIQEYKEIGAAEERHFLETKSATDYEVARSLMVATLQAATGTSLEEAYGFLDAMEGGELNHVKQTLQGRTQSAW